ncbi:glycosyltransferase [Pseudodesulfovibrio sp. zrk46]|uniref:glycosyltransferase family protein n=1 Tax=Pseudodesulfovibrio sp. zrk46 TaxID=2725288 RepID=UPI001448BF6A|nr:glycosyltransferase [Pseudodesulfovibrio sp. zrk46]QJB55916.1 glycosyltransferase family 1 protein [Pseudodesulfovibrio sp. zrk46]
MGETTAKPLEGLKVAWLEGHYFVKTFMEECGAEVKHVYVREQPRDWDWVVERCGFEPDILIYADRSRPPMLFGLESFPCLTVFLSVDSHIHKWFPIYAQAFDLCTVSLKDHIADYQGKRLPDDRIFWLPAFARETDMPMEAEKIWDLLFVGNVKEDIFPVRARMLRELGEKFSGLHVAQGAYRELFAQARLVLNIAERGDMNYRLFEALGCKSCLVTPKIGHGQDELFTDGEDLFTYDQDDVDGLVALVESLLQDEERCRKVAESGYAKVNNGHRERNRASDFAHWLDSFDRQALVNERLRNATTIFEASLKLLYLHHAETMEEPAWQAAYLRAAQRGA